MVLNPIVHVSDAPVKWILHVCVEAEVGVTYEVVFCDRQLPQQNFVTPSAKMLDITSHIVATLNTPKHIYIYIYQQIGCALGSEPEGSKLNET